MNTCLFYNLLILGFNKVGGYSNLKYQYSRSIPSIRDNTTSCGIPREDAFHIFRHPVHSDNPWPGLVLQSSVGCLWYWCADQVIYKNTIKITRHERDLCC